jgi:hypothetical protein
MQRLTTDQVVQACRLFLPLAYCAEASIPAKRRCFLDLPAGEDMFAYLAGNAAANEWCQVVGKDGQVQALLIRLGCSHYPNLKLKIQRVNHDLGPEWLFSVDTHDAFSKTSFLPPPNHPEAAAWMELQKRNTALKECIEAAWERAGLATFNGLLRRDLEPGRPSLA